MYRSHWTLLENFWQFQLKNIIFSFKIQVLKIQGKLTQKISNNHILTFSCCRRSQSWLRRAYRCILRRRGRLITNAKKVRERLEPIWIFQHAKNLVNIHFSFVFWPTSPIPLRNWKNDWIQVLHSLEIEINKFWPELSKLTRSKSEL